jgi:5-methylthioadenosine/S-adenosylhomocysteine deaminase
MPSPLRLLMKGGRVLDLDSEPHHPPVADVLIADGRIAAIGAVPDEPGAPPPETIELNGKLIVPGFVNAHYHSHDIFLKGCFDPSVLEFWALNALPRAYPPRSDEEIRLRTLLGAVECIRGGITTVQDMLTLYPLTAEQVDVVRSAYEIAGLRAILGLQVADVSPLDTMPYWRETIPADLQGMIMGGKPVAGPDPIAVMNEVFPRRDPQSRISWAVSPSSPERCSRALLERLADVARRFDLPVYAHIYISRAEALTARRLFGEYNGSMIDYLDAIGLLGPKLTLAHGVWLDQREIEKIAAAGGSVVLNLLSNLKTKNGVAPIRRMLAAGINLALGCDNCSCSDAQNIFQAMKLYTFLAAVSGPAEGPPDAIDALRAATIAGARTAGLQNQIGSLRPGMRADLVVIDTNDPVYLPFNSAARQIVYGEGGRAVTMVIVDGRVVMHDRVVQTVDEAELRDELARIVPSFRADAEKVFARTARLRPSILEADRRIWLEDIGIDRFVPLKG